MWVKITLFVFKQDIRSSSLCRCYGILWLVWTQIFCFSFCGPLRESVSIVVQYVSEWMNTSSEHRGYRCAYIIDNNITDLDFISSCFVDSRSENSSGSDCCTIFFHIGSFGFYICSHPRYSPHPKFQLLCMMRYAVRVLLLLCYTCSNQRVYMDLCGAWVCNCSRTTLPTVFHSE